MKIPKIFDFNNDGNVDYREACEAVDTLGYSGDEVAMLTGHPEYHFLGDRDRETLLTGDSDQFFPDEDDE